MSNDAQTNGPIIVGVDGSDDGLRAVEYGARVSVQTGRKLKLVHAVDDAVLAGAWGVIYDPTMLQESGRQAVDEARARAIEIGADEDLIESEVLMGNPGAVLTRLSENASIVVVGRRAISGLERLFVGSTSAGISVTAHCPVIMVSAASTPEPTAERGLVGIGLDDGPRAEFALEWAFQEAKARGWAVEAVHAWQPPRGLFTGDAREGEDERIAAVEKMITDLVRRVADNNPDVPHTLDIVESHPIDELIRRSDKYGLLVLGVNPHLPGIAPGARVRALMAHAHSPLALVRPRD